LTSRSDTNLSILPSESQVIVGQHAGARGALAETMNRHYGKSWSIAQLSGSD